MARSFAFEFSFAPFVLGLAALGVSLSGNACLGTTVNLGAPPEAGVAAETGPPPECTSNKECRDKFYLGRCFSGVCVSYADDESGCTRPMGDATDQGDTIVLGTFFSKTPNFDSARTALLEATAARSLARWNEAAGTAQVRKAAAIACDEATPDLGKAISHMRALGVNVVVGPSSPLLARTVAMLANDRKLTVIAPFQEEDVPPKAMFQGKPSRVDMSQAAIAAVKDVVALLSKARERPQLVYILSGGGDADRELHAKLEQGLSMLAPTPVTNVVSEDENFPATAREATLERLPDVIVINSTQSATAVIHAIESRGWRRSPRWKPVYVIFGGDPVSLGGSGEADGRAYWGQFASEFESDVDAIRTSLATGLPLQNGVVPPSTEFRWAASDAFFTALFAVQFAAGVRPASQVIAFGMNGLNGPVTGPKLFFSGDRLGEGFTTLEQSSFVPIAAIGATGVLKWELPGGRRTPPSFMVLRCRRDSAWHGTSRRYRVSDGGRHAWVLPPELPADALCRQDDP